MGEVRLVGVRTSYGDMPQPVRDFAEDHLGSPVVEVVARVGGMSPAVAASVRAANGRAAFIKAVGPEIHPDTPTHFRHEIDVLRVLSPAPYRVGLLAAYDDGAWVALLLDDVDGRHPDWGDPSERAAVLDVVKQQSQELTPPLPGLPTVSVREAMEKHLGHARTADSVELAALPGWARTDLGALLELTARTVEHHRDDSFCHWDIRHDNILIRHRDHQPVLLDWGMSRRGQRWGDIVCFGLEWVESADFDTIVETLDLSAAEQADITGFLVGFGVWALMMSTVPVHPSLPHMSDFRRDVGTRCLTGVRRRLDLGLA